MDFFLHIIINVLFQTPITKILIKYLKKLNELGRYDDLFSIFVVYISVDLNPLVRTIRDLLSFSNFSTTIHIPETIYYILKTCVFDNKGEILLHNCLNIQMTNYLWHLFVSDKTDKVILLEFFNVVFHKKRLLCTKYFKIYFKRRGI